MEKKISKVKKHCRPFTEYIPRDLIEEIVVTMASTSSDSLHDLKVLRGCCKSFYEASKSRRVGRAIRVDDTWHLSREEYIIFLRNCVDSGNLEASFQLGLVECIKLNMDSGIQHIMNAANKGHLLAGYAAGIILYKNEMTRDSGMRILSMVANGKIDNVSKPMESKRSGNAIINNCRRSAAKHFGNIAWGTGRKWTTKEEWRCDNYLCGRKAKDVDHNEWLGEDALQRDFCSQLCRWKYEFCLFSNHM